MNPQPLVSIITPSYNQGRFLEQTMLSVLDQSYPNIEYIVIDGGSTDSSKAIIEKYANRLSYWQSQPDKGQANAINIGFEKSKGEIIAFLNSDDLLEPDAAEKIVEAFRKNKNAVFIYGKCCVIDESGRELNKAEGALVNRHDLLKKGMHPRIYQPACFFNRSYIKRHLFLQEKLNFSFDYELILYLLSKGKAVFIDAKVASHRIHDEAKSIKYERAHFLEGLKVKLQYAPEMAPLWAWRYLKGKLRCLLEKLGVYPRMRD